MQFTFQVLTIYFLVFNNPIYNIFKIIIYKKIYQNTNLLNLSNAWGFPVVKLIPTWLFHSPDAYCEHSRNQKNVEIEADTATIYNFETTSLKMLYDGRYDTSKLPNPISGSSKVQLLVENLRL